MASWADPQRGDSRRGGRYGRFERLYWRYAPIIQLVVGAFVTAVAVFLAVIAVLVFAQDKREGARRRQERVVVRQTCERSRAFGPPLIDHLEKVEARFHLGALERVIEWPIGSKRFEPVLKFYRATIPTSCPGPPPKA